jgi:glycosyltransferase involved in cell wall biosynthesis
MDTDNFRQPLFSIIIPVYNTEKYLRHCLDSVLAQTFKDFEVILVDDGSTDGTGQICDEYAAKDNRFQVIHKKNGGVATARQAGTDIASGNYIIHADPDDWIEPEMLNHMLMKANENDADVTICDFYSTNIREKDTLIRQKPSSLKPHSVLEDIVLFHRLHGSLCNKLAKRACYMKYGLSFTPGIDYC